MLTDTTIAEASDTSCPSTLNVCESSLTVLQKYFDVEFSVVCGKTGDALRVAADQTTADWQLRASLCRAVAELGSVEFIGEQNHSLALAIPLHGQQMDPVTGERPSFVAVADFRSCCAPEDADHTALAAELGMPAEQAAQWFASRAAWDPDSLLRMAELAQLKIEETIRLSRNVEGLSDNLASTYEEITLLYRITENLRIGEDPAIVWESALKWLSEVLPAQTLAIQFVGDETKGDEELFVSGPSPVATSTLSGLVNRMASRTHERPLVVNRQAMTKDSLSDGEPWGFDDVDQFAMVPVSAGGRCFGYLMAANHVDEAEFGTVEGSLLSSVASILGVHCSNVTLFREQAELMAGIVRALSSAIDAKDPYTRGHSDRVARVAVRIAEQMGLSTEDVKTIYLSGLLHDVGKIGIADSVLRKPGRLTDAEYEHIKLHPGLGHKILKDIRKIEHVLPGVLHHHEAVNGKGYPEGLAGDEIPLQARIIAVADSFDAMGSDRPYRKGMDEQKVDSILRHGSGEQWDADVIEAFFEVREDIRGIVDHECDAIQLDFHFLV